LNEFNHLEPGDANGDVWDDFANELIKATPEENIKRRDLYDGQPLITQKVSGASHTPTFFIHC